MCKAIIPYKFPVGCVGVFPPRRHRHFFAVGAVPANGRFHKALRLFEAAVHHGMIDPGNAVHRHLSREALVGGVVLGDHQKAAGGLVDPVHNAGAHHPADGGKPPCTVVEQRVYQRAVRVAGRGVHHHSLGLVYHQKVIVLIHDLNGNILRRRAQGLCIRQLQPDALPGPELQIFGRRRLLAAHAALFQQLLHRTARELQLLAAG